MLTDQPYQRKSGIRQSPSSASHRLPVRPHLYNFAQQIIPENVHADPEAFFSSMLEDPVECLNLLWNIAQSSYPYHSDNIGVNDFRITVTRINNARTILIRFPAPVTTGESFAVAVMEMDLENGTVARCITFEKGRSPADCFICDITSEGRNEYADCGSFTLTSSDNISEQLISVLHKMFAGA